MMKIYHAHGTRSTRAIWLFEELGLPYEMERFDSLADPRLREATYKGVHPMSRVPALEDGDLTIFESGAIVQYVLAKYGDGRLVPDMHAPEFGPYLQWLHYTEGMIMPQVNILVVETKILPAEKSNPVNIARATKLLTRMLSAVESGLDGRDYLAGDFSGADIMCGHACIVARRLDADLSDKPNVEAYTDRLNARPALEKAWAT